MKVRNPKDMIALIIYPLYTLTASLPDKIEMYQSAFLILNLSRFDSENAGFNLVSVDCNLSKYSLQ